MNKALYFLLAVGLFAVTSCERDNDGDRDIEIPEFNFAKTVDFEDSLAAYEIYQGNPVDLIPSDDFHLMELSSILYTDYAQKQRLVKVPDGEQMERLDDGSISFPDGTILVKTFYYYNDERDPSLGKRVIETRLLIKESNRWNVATYLWSNDQSYALLELNGHDTDVSWISSTGNNISTYYHVPTENECMTCHQSNSEMIPLGTKLRNLNRDVVRNGTTINQISHLQSVDVISDFVVSEVPEIVDYSDPAISLSDRGRAYLDMNCAHCHNPSAWERSAERDFDFRYETDFDATGLKHDGNRVIDALLDERMPLIGTTIQDKEGIDLVIEFIENQQ